MSIIQLPGTILQGVGMGQSLGEGEPGPAVLSTTQPNGNFKLFDSSGNYDITLPNAGTLSSVPLVTPLRPVGGSSTTYATNIKGEDVGTACANTVKQLALYERASPCAIGNTCVALGGQGIDAIGKGGTANAYAAWQYEARAFLHQKASIATLYVLLTHGEGDALNASYASQVNAGIWSVVQADAAAIGGQVAAIAKAFFQQNSSPVVTPGVFNPPISATQQLLMHTLGYASLIGPEYQYPSIGIHKPSAQYLRMGEKAGQVIWRLIKSLGWNPVYPTAFSVVSNVVTVTFAVPFGPLQWSNLYTSPHATGVLSGWGTANGFEWTELNTAITNCVSGTGGVCRLTANAHGMSTGDAAVVLLVGGVVNANGAWTITVIDANTIELQGSTFAAAYTSGGTIERVRAITGVSFPASNQVAVTLSGSPSVGGALAYAYTADTASGGNVCNRSGLLCDSDPYIGLFSGTTNPNFGVTFKQSGLT